ncbi:P-type atpase, partial [Globisporangium splendens]
MEQQTEKRQEAARASNKPQDGPYTKQSELEAAESEDAMKATKKPQEPKAQTKVTTTAATSHAPPQVEPRVAFLNDSIRNQELMVSKRYAKNVIVTSKYTAVSFVPKTLFEFFRVTANVYFLVISLLQLLTTWSPTNRFTTAGPLVFVLLVTMIKQGSEDRKRHQADEHQNNHTCRIVDEHGTTQTIAWQELQVGQIVCVRNNEELPADAVILATSEEEGRCFIETCNVMEFRKCSIGGQSYGFSTTEIGRAVAALQPGGGGAARVSQTAMAEVGVTLSTELNSSSASDVRERTAPIFGNDSTTQMPQSSPEGDPKLAQVHCDPNISFDDPSLLRHLNAGGPRGELTHEFLTLLAIRHTVIPEVDKKTGAVTYRVSSPDEEALVKAAKCLGYNFVDPAPLTKIEITRKNMDSGRIEPNMSISQQYTILNVNEFNSSRKRMSIVAVNANTGEYVLHCKGADNMMLPRAVGDEYTTNIQQHLRVFAGEGLRTLVLAKRVLAREEYDHFNERYIAASTSLQNREEQLDAVAEMIETNMQILGITAIEDKLQENVPSTILDLAQAGIKIWVLTGDREETAINIGHACRLVDDRMKLLYVNQESIQGLEQQLNELYQAPFIQQLLRTGTVSDEIAMMSDDTRERTNLLAIKLLSVASVCKALIECRVSPSQKAEIVSLVRNRSSSLPSNSRKAPPITLAIGDGANDVSVIQTAHVGVGICGKEGVQAVNASDYVISQFKFLKRLVLTHGRFNYKRICKVIRYSFYKNIALVISLFLFNFCNGQSGATLFESFVMAGWNFFLATPIIVIGVFDQDMPDAIVLKFPKLYRAGQGDSDLNLTVFVRTITNAVLHACICFSVCYGCCNPNHSLFYMGTLFYTVLLATMKWKVVLLTPSWNKYHVLLLGFSMWLFVFFLIVYPLLTFLSFDTVGVPMRMLCDDLFWYLLFMCPIAVILLDFAVLTLQQRFVPMPEDILRERYRMNASMRISGKAGIVPDNMPSLPSFSSPAAKTTTHSKRIGGIDNALVFPTDDIWPQASSLSLLSSQIDMSKTHSTNGFAFNGPESSSVSVTHAEELVTKRVNTFTENQRIDSTRMSSAIIPKRAASPARQQEDEAANARSTSTAPMQDHDEVGS